MDEQNGHFWVGLVGLLVLVLAIGAIIYGLVLHNEGRDVFNAEPGDCVGGITVGDDGSVTSDPDDAVRLDCDDPDARHKVAGYGSTSAVNPHPMDAPSDPCKEFPTSHVTLVLYVNTLPDEVLCLEARYLSPSVAVDLPGILVRAIAADDPDVCDYFTEQGAAQFAATVDANSCTEAITTLAGQITDSASYTNLRGDPIMNLTDEINACALTWTRIGHGPVTAGPQLGHFRLTHLDNAPGYLIDRVRPC